MSTTRSSLPPTIEAVLFDYGMVLSGPPNAAAWERLRRLTGLNEEQMQRHYWASRHAYDRGDCTGTDYFQQLAAKAGMTDVSAATVAELLDADTDLWTDLNEPMLDWAQRLQRRGVRTGILSNLGDAMHAGVLRKFSWIGAFDHCTWSHTLKIAKPEAAIYQHAAEGLQTAPGKILFVDDKMENLQAAEHAGMQVIPYPAHAEFLREMERRGLGWLL